MATVQSEAQGASQPGIIQSIKAFLATWVGLIRTRLELFSNDLEEQRVRYGQIVVLAVAAFLSVCFGLLTLMFFLVVLFWEDYRLVVLGAFTILYLGGGVALALVVRQKMKSKPKFLAATLEELSKDFKHLSS